MNLITMCLVEYAVLFEVLNAGVLAYVIATSKGDGKKIIKTVLTGTAVYAIVSITLTLSGIGIGSVVMPFVIFPIVFGILGRQTGKKFNASGLVFLVIYLASLFILPVISNKHETSDLYQLLEGIIGELDVKLAPTQFEMIEIFSDLSVDSVGNLLEMFMGAVFITLLLFEMLLLRKNTAQVVLGGILSAFTAGMLYFDYRIFHSDSLGGKLAGIALSKMGFSLSPFCILILLFAIMTIITAQRCKKKESAERR